MSTSVKFTYDQYEEMIRLGLFDPPEEHRVELIYGKIVPVYGRTPMSPINPPHDYSLDRLNEWSFEVLPRGVAWVRVQGSIAIPLFDSGPQPDLVWLAREDYSNRRPTAKDILLLVEVSDTTLKKDRGSKARLYAAAGIRDYWIINIRGRCIEVRRDPKGSKFQSLTIFKPGREVPPSRLHRRLAGRLSTLPGVIIDLLSRTDRRNPRSWYTLDIEDRACEIEFLE